MSWSTSLLRMKPPCVVKPLHLCSPKAPRSRKRRRDSCFHNLNGYSQPSYSNGLVAQMLAGGTPDQRGDMDYRCRHCARGQHLVAMSCTASLGLRGAQGSVDTWGNQVRQALQAGVI